MFLFGAPENLSTTPWTSSAISFTKAITDSSKTSVVSINYLMVQNPKIATTLCPGTIGSTSPVWPILSEIILTPASPKPRATSAPTFTIVYSNIAVSSKCGFVPFSGSFLMHKPFQNSKSIHLFLFFLLISPNLSLVSASLSSLDAASSGFVAILYIFSIILKTGPIITVFASLVKREAPTAKATQTNNVRIRLKTATSLKFARVSNTTMIKS